MANSINDAWMLFPPDGTTGDYPHVRPPIETHVYRFQGNGDDSDELLDNLTWTEIEHRIGTFVPTAKIVYRFGIIDPQAPQSFEDALSEDGEVLYAKAINPGDRILIKATIRNTDKPPVGGVIFTKQITIFDGFAQAFNGTIDPRQEVVEILCLGTEIRCWDQPTQGSIWRNGDAPTTVKDVATQVAAHFNPKGKGNCCPDGTPKGAAWDRFLLDGDQRYPTFMDPDNTHTGAQAPRTWDLTRAARYLIYTGNRDETYVRNPDGSGIDALLLARLPIVGIEYDPNDPTTFVYAEIPAPDKPFAGKDWPSVLHDLISSNGFEMRWLLHTDDFAPSCGQLELFAPWAMDLKDLWLQPRNTDLNLGFTNLGKAQIGRDLTNIANEWMIEGQLEEKEASYILGPGFGSQIADPGSVTALAAYDKSNSAMILNGYRLFVFDETGEGHYLPLSTAVINTAPSLDAIWGAPVIVNGVPVPQYVVRRRDPIGKLNSTDGAGRRRDALLEISTDYGGTQQPHVWQTGGTWRPIAGGWELLKDRIGVYLNCQNPNTWQIGKSTTTGAPFRNGVVKVVECITKQAAPNPYFWLRLTVVTRGDVRCRGFAGRKLNNLIPIPVRRVMDAHDRYKRESIKGPSALFNGGADKVTRDDSAAALAEAIATQLATENGPVAGDVLVPRMTGYYEPGDRIRSIQGRNVGFRTNAATDQDGYDDQVEIYPTVIGRKWTNDRRGQLTWLTLSDANASRHSYMKALRRHHDPKNN